MSQSIRKLLEDLDERNRRRHEYALADRRISEDNMCRQFERRIRSLEDWRILLTGGLAGIFAWMKLGGGR